MIVDTQKIVTKTLQEAGIETAQLDARLLMMHVLGVSLEELLLHRDSDFPLEKQGHLDECVQKRLQGMPVAKIIGVKEFWGLPFKTTMDTLDPRPDSETLIEAVLDNLPDRQKSYRILDLGTGTGCLLISLLSELPNATGVGIDQSEAALSVAQENAAVLNVADRSHWHVSDWFSNVVGQFDIIMSNPPYIPTGDIARLCVDVRGYDPHGALDGGTDGLEPYRLIAQNVAPFLSENALVGLEYGQGQTQGIQNIFGRSGIVYKDLAGIERCLLFKV